MWRWLHCYRHGLCLCVCPVTLSPAVTAPAAVSSSTAWLFVLCMWVHGHTSLRSAQTSTLSAFTSWLSFCCVPSAHRSAWGCTLISAAPQTPVAISWPLSELVQSRSLWLMGWLNLKTHWSCISCDKCQLQRRSSCDKVWLGFNFHEAKSCLIHFSLLFSDYSKGFGGKFGVQNDRMDKVKYSDKMNTVVYKWIERSVLLGLSYCPRIYLYKSGVWKCLFLAALWSSPHSSHVSLVMGLWTK